MKLILKLFLFMLISVLGSIVLSFVLTLIFFGVPHPGMRVEYEGLAYIGLFGNIFAVCGFVLLIYYGIVKRVQKINKATKDVAEGKYDVDLSAKGKDELSELSRNFISMANELKANEYMNREYVKNVSHEIKTPLSSIKGYADLTAQAQTLEAAKKYSDIISKISDKVIANCRQMLKLSMLESSNLIKKEDDFDVSGQIRTTILMLQNQWQEKNITFDVDFDSVFIRSNKELLENVWQNLISNAVKFSLPNGCIRVSVKQGERLYVEIEDNGIGIKEEDKPHIFRQFYTVNNSHDGTNTGVGLNLSKKIIEKLGGQIRFESAENSGTTFFVSLPLS